MDLPCWIWLFISDSTYHSSGNNSINAEKGKELFHESRAIKKSLSRLIWLPLP
jgi:hypothetical protein